MRKKTILLVAIALVLGVLQSNAQVTFGVKGGLNVANISVKAEGVKVKYNPKIGFRTGVMVNLPISESISIEPAVLYSGKGAKGDDDNDLVALASDESFLFDYVEIPLNVFYSFNLNNTDNIKPFVFAGPYLGYLISAKNKYSDGTEKIEIGTSNDTDIRPLDYGANIGAGVRFSNFLISVQYGIGLANLSNVESGKIQNGVFGISVGYRFGRN